MEDNKWPKMVTPFVGCGVVVEDFSRKNIAVIERKYQPYGYAFPAGMMEVGETAEQCAVRETKEETNLDVALRGVLTVISDPGFDPRWHAVSIYMVGRQISDEEIQAKDDALKALWMPWEPRSELEREMTEATRLVLFDYRRYRMDQEVGQVLLSALR